MTARKAPTQEQIIDKLAAAVDKLKLVPALCCTNVSPDSLTFYSIDAFAIVPRPAGLVPDGTAPGGYGLKAFRMMRDGLEIEKPTVPLDDMPEPPDSDAVEPVGTLSPEFWQGVRDLLPVCSTDPRRHVLNRPAWIPADGTSPAALYATDGRRVDWIESMEAPFTESTVFGVVGDPLYNAIESLATRGGDLFTLKQGSKEHATNWHIYIEGGSVYGWRRTQGIYPNVRQVIPSPASLSKEYPLTGTDLLAKYQKHAGGKNTCVLRLNSGLLSCYDNRDIPQAVNKSWTPLQPLTEDVPADGDRPATTTTEAQVGVDIAYLLRAVEHTGATLYAIVRPVMESSKWARHATAEEIEGAPSRGVWGPMMLRGTGEKSNRASIVMPCRAV